MGFDIECVLNIQSLPGEYFCPVCRTLICPNEALQSQCTHLYCKPCLAYIVATTQACPYDGYLVSEANSKPLMDSNKPLAETVGKVTVRCLYHKSGCQWQGNLSDCITHGGVCAYGNSPVVCNHCGTQIVHRQVQEHAQLCPGSQPQTQQADSSVTQSSAATTQAVTQYQSAVTSAAPAVAVTAAPAATVPSAITSRAITSVAATSSAGATTASTVAVTPSLAAAPISTSQGQAFAPQTPAAEQYQQQLQYQQYYQQHYPGYNPYTQQYGQYGQYQQYTQPQMQVAPQNVSQPPAQPAPFVLQPSQPQHTVPSQSQIQSHRPQLQAQTVQLQPQQNPPLQPAPQFPQMQLPHPQAHPTPHPPAPTQIGSQPFATPATQATPTQVQPHLQAHPPEHQQVVSQQHLQLQHLPQQQNLQLQIQHKHPQVQQQSYPYPQAYQQPHPMPLAQPQNPSLHVVTGHQTYAQPQPAHHMPQGAPLQHHAHVSHQQVVGSQHHALVRPSQPQFPLQGQQPAMPPQETQPTPKHQQNVAHHAQWPLMHSSVPSQAPQQGFLMNTLDGAESSDKGKGNGEFVGRESNSHGSDVRGHKESKASDTSNDLEKGGPLQHASQQNPGAPGSYAPPSMGPQHPSGHDRNRMHPQHMLHPGSTMYAEGQLNQTRPPKHSFPENIRPSMLQQSYDSYHSEMAPRAPVPNQNQMPIPQPATIKPNDSMVRPPMGGPLPGLHDTTVPPFASENVGRLHPLGTAKSNGVGHPDFVSPFAEFGHHRIDGMPTMKNTDPFLQGMTGGPGGLRKDQLGSGNLRGNVHHDFRSPEFPHARFHPSDTFALRNLHGGGEPLGHGQIHGVEPFGHRYQGHMHPDDQNLVTDYSRHGFPKESAHFGLGGHLRNGDIGWCRICSFNCGSAGGLDLHVQTREHQQYAMDIILKMKHDVDVAKRQKMNSGVFKTFNKKVAGKGNFRGNRR